MFVYLLFHTHEVNAGEDDDKLIGVYSTREKAEAARQRASTLPGFRDCPDGFCIDRYAVDDDEEGWSQGFITLRPGEE
jgi:hypothetical protein